MDADRRRRSAARSRIIGRVYAQWAAEQAGQFTPDPRFAADPAYSEHAPLISASPQSQDDLLRRTAEALAVAGLATHGREDGHGA